MEQPDKGEATLEVEAAEPSPEDWADFRKASRYYDWRERHLEECQGPDSDRKED